MTEERKRNAPPAEVREECLKAEQQADLARIKEITGKSLAYLDYSPTGTGKTRVTCRLAKDYGLSLFVVCPLAAISTWEVESAAVGSEIGVAITLGQLAGKVNCVLGHPYLVRDEKSGRGYKATEEFAKLAERGILLVFDEAHHGKNIATCIHSAFSALSQYIAASGGLSRIALLSATIVDKAGLQCVAAIELMGLAPLPLYVQHRNRPIELTGFHHLVERAAALDPPTTKKITARFAGRKWTTALVAEEATRLFVQVFVPALGSTMCPIIYQGIERRFVYKYFDLDPSTQEKYEEACVTIDDAARRLAGRAAQLGHVAAHAGRENGPPPAVKELFGVITKWLVRLDCLLIEPALRQARQWLEGGDSKVVICLNVIRCSEPLHSHNHINYLFDQLREYGPVEYTGEMDRKTRIENVARFQEPSSGTRVLIATSPSLKESINLHDTSGDSPAAMQIVDGKPVAIRAADVGGSKRGSSSPAGEPLLPTARGLNSGVEPQEPPTPGVFPRKAVIMPSYRMTDIHQIAGRFYRFGVSSNVELVIPLGKGRRELRSILNSIACKSDMLAVVTHHAEMGVLFPGDYGVEIEGEGQLSEEEQKRYRGDASQLQYVLRGSER